MGLNAYETIIYPFGKVFLAKIQQDDTNQWLVILDMTPMERPDVVSPVTTILASSAHYGVYKGLFYNTVIFHLHHWRKHKHAEHLTQRVLFPPETVG